jgi:hypothetical protein
VTSPESPRQGADRSQDADGTLGAGAPDDEIVDAEIVETPEPPPAAATPGPPAGPASPGNAAAVRGSAPVPGVPADPVTDYTDAGVPTFAYLQEKVERRYATALGSQELAEATIPQVAEAAKRREDLAKSAQERLEEIRRSLHSDAPGDPWSPTSPAG